MRKVLFNLFLLVLCQAENLLYVSGPIFSTCQKATQEMIAKMAQEVGFQTYLPQTDGLEFAQLSLVPGIDSIQLTNAIFLVDVSQVLKSNTIVVNFNGDTPDSGSVVEASLAYALGKQVIIYRYDVRSFIGTLPLNPMVLGLRSAPIAQNMTVLHQLLIQAKNQQLSAVIPFIPAQIYFWGSAILSNKHNPNTLISIFNTLGSVYPNATTIY